MMFPAIFFGLAVVHAVLAVLHGIGRSAGWALFSAVNAGLFVFFAVLNIA